MRLGDSSIKNDQPTSTTPEEVLLQITLAFMVFLGYLLSKQVEHQDAVDQRVSEVNELAKSILNEENGGIAQQLASSNIENEKLKLLRQWEQLKRTNIFFCRIADFRVVCAGREAGPLSTLDLDFKLGNEQFQALRRETTRLFLRQEGHKNPQIEEEIARCFVQCVGNAGFSPARTDNHIPDSFKSTYIWKRFELIAQTDGAPNKFLAHDSQQFILDTIGTDFKVAREEVAAIQSDAALRFAIQRIEKDPISVAPSDADRSSQEGSLFSPAILNRLFKQADAQLQLLPEVKDALQETLKHRIESPSNGQAVR